MMEALMGKIDKLSIKMISRHYVSSCKVKKAKTFIRRALFPSNESVAENFDDDKKEDVVNHEKSLVHTKVFYMRHS